MFNKKIFIISIIFILLFIPNVFSEIKQITSADKNQDASVSTELLISTTIKKEFNLVYETIKSDMMEEIKNSQDYVDEQIEKANANLSYFYLKVIISLSLINLISIIFAHFIVFKIKTKEIEYLNSFQNSISIDKNKNIKNDINKDLNNLNKNIDTIPKPVYKDDKDNFVSIDKI